MKAVINLELFGEDVRQRYRLAHACYDLAGIGDVFDAFVGVPPRSSWVAEIVGPDEKYGLARKFMRFKLDYSRANSNGSRGIFAEYILETGKIYEVRSQTSWQHYERFFCCVSEDGDVVKIPEEDACLAVGAKTKEERMARRNAEKLSRH